MILSYVRTIILYLALIISVRLMGKRQVGQMEPSEFVVTMLIANLAAVPLENPEMPVWGGLVPMGIIFLCERGIRTFETSTRNTLDLSAMPVLRQRTHLPIIVDPSHAAGERDLVCRSCNKNQRRARSN